MSLYLATNKQSAFNTALSAPESLDTNTAREATKKAITCFSLAQRESPSTANLWKPSRDDSHDPILNALKSILTSIDQGDWSGSDAERLYLSLHCQITKLISMNKGSFRQFRGEGISEKDLESKAQKISSLEDDVLKTLAAFLDTRKSSTKQKELLRKLYATLRRLRNFKVAQALFKKYVVALSKGKKSSARPLVKAAKKDPAKKPLYKAAAKVVQKINKVLSGKPVSDAAFKKAANTFKQAAAKAGPNPLAAKVAGELRRIAFASALAKAASVRTVAGIHRAQGLAVLNMMANAAVVASAWARYMAPQPPASR